MDRNRNWLQFLHLVQTILAAGESLDIKVKGSKDQEKTIRSPVCMYNFGSWVKDETINHSHDNCNEFVTMNYTNLIFTMFIYNIYIHPYKHAHIHTHVVSLVTKNPQILAILSRLTSAWSNKSSHQRNVPNNTQSPVHSTQIWFHYHKKQQLTGTVQSPKSRQLTAHKYGFTTTSSTSSQALFKAQNHVRPRQRKKTFMETVYQNMATTHCLPCFISWTLAVHEG